MNRDTHHNQRPPIVTIMGHVDHGKTSILDSIRRTEIQSSEDGGITQSIGAYQVIHNDRKITFVDTPGHAAFSKMRARGGQVADLVVLVIAADDGIRPQTIEATDHIRAAGVPFIVAINKVDLATANTIKVKKQLHDHGIEIEEYGGSIKVFETSASTGAGLDTLLDGIIETAAELNLESDPEQVAEGVIIESRLNAKSGVVVSAIVLNGNLKLRTILLAGHQIGRVKQLLSWKGQPVDHADRSDPVQVLGFSNPPEVGANFKEFRSLKLAQRELAKQPDRVVAAITPADRVRKAFQQGKNIEIPLVIKADTQGSLEAIIESIHKVETEGININILHSGVGEITENDVFLAIPVNALVIGFRVETIASAEQLARREGIFHRTYRVIYELIEELEDMIKGEKLGKQEKVIGEAKVKKLFELRNGEVVAGSLVTSGKLTRGLKIKLIRNQETIAQSRIKSLRQHKEVLNKIEEGEDCGILIDNKIGVQIGDVIQGVE